MRIGKHAIFVVVALAATVLALGAAFDHGEGHVRPAGRAQVVVVEPDGDRYERSWVFDSDAGWLGVTLRDDDDGGARIVAVMDDSPAEAAGLEPGDVIVGVDGDAIETPGDLTRAIRGLSPEDEVELEVRRGGDLRTVAVELGEAPGSFAFRLGDTEGFPFGFAFDGDALEGRLHELHEQLKGMHIEVPHLDFEFGGFHRRPLLGIQVVQPTPELREHLGAPRDSGILVGKVHEGTPAEEAGLQVGDVILAVDGDEVSDAGDVSRALRRARGETLVLDVIRDGRTMTLEAFLPEPEEPEDDFIRPSRPLRYRAPAEEGAQKA